MKLPLRSRRSQNRVSKSRKRPIVKPGAQPEIFVKVHSERRYGGYDYIHARIQLRRAKYRYLVWYEEGRKREFYLGQVKSLPLTRTCSSARSAAELAGAGKDLVGAGK